MSLTINQKIWIKELSYNLLALLFIYLVPLLSRSLHLPFYYIDPMRLMIILAIAHTSKRNAYILAIILPLFSFVISSHPSMYKMLSIMIELLLNIYLFYFLWKKLKTIFVAILASIVFSKMIYYLIKYLFIEIDLIETSLFSTPWLPQMIMTLIFSIYLWVIFSYIRIPKKD